MAGRRTLGIGFALFIEALLLLLLLTLGPGATSGLEKQTKTTVFNVRDLPEDQPEAERPQPQRAATQPQPQQPQQQPDQPQPPQPSTPPAAPTNAPVAPPVPPAVVPMNWSLAPGTPHPPAAPATPAYGPPDTRSAAMRDSVPIGAAPNGEPLYAAEWYREPAESMMRSYLSTARPPGYGLIACRTAPDYRVEDCVGIEEYPEGSNIMRSALAAAWEFRVRPPRRGGRPLIGSWVRIRISYDMRRERPAYER